jgi:predicted house-cleaning noncanonical NTP pyrophosphatase (MazG superfamily)
MASDPKTVLQVPRVIASWDDAGAIPTESQLVGGKAKGIFRLPLPWVPRFIVFTKTFFDSWRAIGISSALSLLDSHERRAIEVLFGEAKRQRARLIVRSNAPVESSVRVHGTFKSIPADASMSSLAGALETVLGQSSILEEVFAIAQLAIEPGLLGHMSNERRVSVRRNVWLVEADESSFRQERISGTPASEPVELIANDEGQVLRCLRHVAGFLETLPEVAFHCEWVWTGQRLWIVQADAAAPVREGLPANRYIQGKSSDSWKAQGRFEILKHFTTLEGNWRKLRRPKLFRSLGLPSADIYVLSGSDWVSGGGKLNAHLSAELGLLCSYPVVVRCDVNDDEYTFLPTSPPSVEPAFLLDFMEREFTRKKVSDENWAFLLANLVPARVSAMVRAFPEAQQVRTDALWGFPDGLLHFPCDSFFYDAATKHVDRNINYKGDCLLFSENKWAYEAVGRPEDWDSTLSNEEINVLSGWAILLANQLGRQVQLMALARIGGERGPEAMLPWHYTEFEIPPYTESMAKLPMTKQIKTLSSMEDLRSDFEPSNTTQAFLVRPALDLIRDTRFLEEVGRFAVQQGKPVYLEGSILGHAYYLLSKSGAHVVPITSDEPSGGIKVYRKLVRDEIPTIIRRAGGLARIRTLSRDDARTLLSRKLIEEAFEVWNAPRDKMADELADVLEVVGALADQYKIEAATIEEIRLAKRRARGGFEKLVYLEETAPPTLDASAAGFKNASLFEHDETYMKLPSANQGEAEVFLYQDGGDRLSSTIAIPLIPPVRSGARLASIEVSDGTLTAEVKYGADRVVIRMYRKEPVSSPDQLELFPKIDESKGK